MSNIDNLVQGEIAQLKKDIRELKFATNQNRMAIGRGGLDVYDGGMITIENGGLKVTGSAEVIGRLFGAGILDWSGDVNISGPLVVQNGGSVTIGSIEFLPDGSASFNTLTIGPDGTFETGSAKINPDGSADFGEFSIAANGDLVSKGTLDIQGDATLKADLNVTTGKIKAGSMTIDPSLLGGSVQFSNGGYLSGTASGPQLTGPAGNAFVYVNNGEAGIQAAAVKLAGDTTVQGSFRVTSPGTVSGVTPNVRMEADGSIRRIV